MSKSIRVLLSVLMAASLAAVSATSSAAEKDKAAEAKAPKAAEKGKSQVKQVFENDHVRIFQATFKPGDVGANAERPLRIIHPVKGGTLTLIYPDGKKEKRVFKTGEAQVVQASPVYMPKNEGKSDIVLFVVYTKEPKK